MTLKQILQKIMSGENAALQRGVSPKPPNAVKPPPSAPPPAPPPPRKPDWSPFEKGGDAGDRSRASSSPPE